MGSSTSKYLERETQMLDHQGQINIHTTVARGPVLVSTVVSYSLAYDDTNVMDNDNLATALSAQIQISIMLIHGKKTISRAYSLSQKMGHYP